MGYGMARSFLRAGHAVHGFDLVPEDDAAVAKLYARNSELGLPGEV
jgi:3-hydroxyisobutyrate dehydrogenase-like beta-hydroxyacid dehydrogenase